MVNTSFRSALNAGEPNAGGGDERNCEVELTKYGVTPPRFAAPGGTPGAGIQKPGPVGIVPVNGSENPSFCRW